MPCSTSVSYTHLDVYKRQRIHSVFNVRPSKVPEYKSEVEHVVGNPTAVQRSEVIFPVAAPTTTKPSTPMTPYSK